MHPGLGARTSPGPPRRTPRWEDSRTESDDWDGRAKSAPSRSKGHHGFVVLNHAAAEVQDYIVAVMQHWLARKVDGWRLDAAYAVPTGFWSPVAGPYPAPLARIVAPADTGL